jgi:thioredoxin reductase (NADPH)
MDSSKLHSGKSVDFDVIVLGGGPAGLTAGIYMARSKASVLIIDSGIPGGQTILTHEIANYPGIESTSGYMLAATMKKQAETFGCNIKSNIQVKDIALSGKTKDFCWQMGILLVQNPLYWLQEEDQKQLVQREKRILKVGYKLLCNLRWRLFQDKEILVVGGGNSALEEAVSLTKYARKVTVVHMLDHWQAFDYAVKEMQRNEKIDFLLNSKIIEFKGTDNLNEVLIENLKDGSKNGEKLMGCSYLLAMKPIQTFCMIKE